MITENNDLYVVEDLGEGILKVYRKDHSDVVVSAQKPIEDIKLKLDELIARVELAKASIR